MVKYSEGSLKVYFWSCVEATLEIYCVQKSGRRTAEAELSFIFNLLLVKLNAVRITEE